MKFIIARNLLVHSTKKSQVQRAHEFWSEIQK